MEEYDNEAKHESGSKTYPVQCSSLRKNGHVMLKNRPCKIMEMSTSKTGKHGHAKVHLVGIDIFTNKKYEDLCPSTHNIDVPNISRSDYTLVDIEDNFASLMDDAGNIRSDLKIPDNEVGAKIKQDFENNVEVILSVLAACGEECIISAKPSAN
ncbi:hypothetical protein RND71_043313 [Anisodus tanguticus]|uniref:Eukaryotic translation initiation factor 5A n=1 Tax=Anisodus tanguticus TaxID=243964 RepID=A0AAE1QNW4_9SOLA|nr:hypothetical protein RND71_043313 [Anisodus tanguticus]